MRGSHSRASFVAFDSYLPSPLRVAGRGLPLLADDIVRFGANYSEKAMSLLFFQVIFSSEILETIITDKSLTHNGFDANKLEAGRGIWGSLKQYNY
jgi:hypothetical protein